MARVRGAAICLCLCLAAACAPKEAPAPSREIDFRSELSRYGEWLVLRPYGRVWHPHERLVGPGFVPYLTGGQWRHSPDGWEFESQWGWGEYTFHRGRWLLGESGLGWVWVPDQERAANWVEWRVSADFVGWTPVAPQAPNQRPLQPFEKPWTFVKTRTFTQAELKPHVLDREASGKALQLTAELPPSRARRGPDPEQIRQGGGLTADGGVPDLTPPPEPKPPEPEVAPAEEKPPEEEPPPPPKKKKGKKAKKSKKGKK